MLLLDLQHTRCPVSPVAGAASRSSELGSQAVTSSPSSEKLPRTWAARPRPVAEVRRSKQLCATNCAARVLSAVICHSRRNQSWKMPPDAAIIYTHPISAKLSKAHSRAGASGQRGCKLASPRVRSSRCRGSMRPAGHARAHRSEEAASGARNGTDCRGLASPFIFHFCRESRLPDEPLPSLCTARARELEQNSSELLGRHWYLYRLLSFILISRLLNNNSRLTNNPRRRASGRGAHGRGEGCALSGQILAERRGGSNRIQRSSCVHG